MGISRCSSQNKQDAPGVVFVSLVGSGTFGKVYQAKRVPQVNSDPQFLAAKVILVKKAPEDFVKKFLPRELEISVELDHPNVIKTYDIHHVRSNIVILMEYAPRGDLLGYCRLRGATQPDVAAKMFSQILKGVGYLHENNIIHRDLKCENILVSFEDKLVVTDFGFSRKMALSDKSSTFCGSAAYAAPELLKGTPYSGYASDIWSLGCILFVILMNEMPFSDSSIRKLLVEQARGPPISDKVLPADCQNLLTSMLNFNEYKRPTAAVIARNVWLRKYFGRL